MERREFLKATSLGLAGLLVPEWVNASPDLRIIESPSPKRRTRASRLSTDYILLHTTEAPSKSSLNSLTRFGKASYMVDTNGDIYRIMNSNQIAVGAGRSMWDGKTNLDNHAINIEFVGYHNKKPTPRQLRNGGELISELKRVFPRVSDKDVMPHSMVAYGRPNRWYEDSHRGRKRCGMLFAKEDIRKSMGLGRASRSDPDFEEGRLVVADSYLQGVLYEGRQPNVISRERPDEADRPENAISTVKAGESIWRYTGREFADSTTTYILKDGRVRRGDELKRERFNFSSVPAGTKIAAGYVFGGHISNNRSAYSVVGKNWNLPSTLYRLPDGRIKSGDEITETFIPNGTTILFRK